MDQTKATLVGIIFSALLALAVGLVMQLYNNPERIEAEAAAATRTVLQETIVAVTATAEFLPTPVVPTAEPDVTATPESSHNYDLALTLAHEWPLAAYDAFDANRPGWSEGGSGLYSRGRRTIDDGIYLWEMTALEGFTWSSAPVGAPFENFYLAVDADKRDKSLGHMSLVFRYLDGDNYYEFGLCPDNESYRVYLEHESERHMLVGCTAHDAIRPDGPNRLAVVGQGDLYLFYVNEQFVKGYNDDLLFGGAAGILIGLEEGDTNLLEFDDFELRSSDLE